MKRISESSRETSLARQRAMIRTLVEKSGWAQASAAISPPAAAGPSEIIPFDNGTRRVIKLAEVIPFPTDYATRGTPEA